MGGVIGYMAQMAHGGGVCGDDQTEFPPPDRCFHIRAGEGDMCEAGAEENISIDRKEIRTGR